MTLRHRLHESTIVVQDTEQQRKRTAVAGGSRWCSCRCLACFAAPVACTAAVILSAERPVLQLQILLGHPQSWLIDKINPQKERGYEVAVVPAALQQMLVEFADSNPPARSFSGLGRAIGEGALEDFIISGPTRFARVPARLEAAAAQHMRPILEAFCDCTLAPRPKVHGLRTYLPGATLAAHLDWPDAWVVSATLCVRRNASLPPWPVALHGRGVPLGGATVALREGEALLYEGSRLWHGRPEPLDGEYTGLFVGFVPVEYPARAGLATRAIHAAVRAVKEQAFRWFHGR